MKPLACLILLAAFADDTFTVTLAFETMHCDECRTELEATVKKIPGFKSSSVAGESVTLVIEDKSPVPAFNRLPKDLRLKSATLALSGTVSFADDKATLVAKGSGASLALANPEHPEKIDRLSELKGKLGGKNRFRVTGEWVGGKTLVLGGFEAIDWEGP